MSARFFNGIFLSIDRGVSGGTWTTSKMAIAAGYMRESGAVSMLVLLTRDCYYLLYAIHTRPCPLSRTLLTLFLRTFMLLGNKWRNRRQGIKVSFGVSSTKELHGAFFRGSVDSV